MRCVGDHLGAAFVPRWRRRGASLGNGRHRARSGRAPWFEPSTEISLTVQVAANTLLVALSSQADAAPLSPQLGLADKRPRGWVRLLAADGPHAELQRQAEERGVALGASWRRPGAVQGPVGSSSTRPPASDPCASRSRRSGRRRTAGARRCRAARSAAAARRWAAIAIGDEVLVVVRHQVHRRHVTRVAFGPVADDQ